MVYCSCSPCNQFITEDEKSGMTYIILAKNKFFRQESRGKSRTMKTCLWQAFLQKNLCMAAGWAVQDDVLLSLKIYGASKASMTLSRRPSYGFNVLCNE